MARLEKKETGCGGILIFLGKLAKNALMGKEELFVEC